MYTAESLIADAQELKPEERVRIAVALMTDDELAEGAWAQFVRGVLVEQGLDGLRAAMKE